MLLILFAELFPLVSFAALALAEPLFASRIAFALLSAAVLSGECVLSELVRFTLGVFPVLLRSCVLWALLVCCGACNRSSA